MNVNLLAVPLLSALVGWITNVAAIRLLFWPVRPLRLPGLRWELRGVIPRRQPDIARSVGEVVERVLLRPEDLVRYLDDGRYRQEAVDCLCSYVDRRLEEGFSRFLPSAMRQAVATYVKGAVNREAQRATQLMMDHLRQHWAREWRLAPTVTERVAALDPGEFEAMLLRVIGRELRWLEALGAVLGFVVGLLQLALLSPWRAGPA